MNWSSKSLGSRLQHEIFYLLVRFRLLWMARGLLACVVLYYTIRPNVRRRIEPYLARRFPKDTGFKRWRHCLRLYWNFAQGLLDRAILGILGPKNCTVVPITQERFRSALPPEQGCIILTGHVGAWQIGLCGLEALQRPINIVQWLDPQDTDRHYFQQNNEQGKHRISLINARDDADAALKIVTALRHGELVCLTGDRVTFPEEPVADVTFMGSTVRLPTTPYLLASLAQVPLVMAFTIRHTQPGKGTLVEGVLVKRMPVPPRIRRNPAAMRQCAQEFARCMEQVTERYPYHFFNFFDMWSQNDRTGMP